MTPHPLTRTAEERFLTLAAEAVQAASKPPLSLGTWMRPCDFPPGELKEKTFVLHDEVLELLLTVYRKGQQATRPLQDWELSHLAAMAQGAADAGSVGVCLGEYKDRVIFTPYPEVMELLRNVAVTGWNAL